MKAWAPLYKDEDGASAIEFALLAPVFIFFFLAAVTFFDVYRTYQNIVQANGIVADVVSRQTSMNATSLDTMYGVFSNIQATRQSGNALRISLLKRKGSSFTVTWTKTRGDDDLFNDLETDASGLPDVADGDSIVLVEGAANYLGLTSLFGMGEIPLSGIAYSRPRFASTVAYQ